MGNIGTTTASGKHTDIHKERDRKLEEARERSKIKRELQIEQVNEA